MRLLQSDGQCFERRFRHERRKAGMVRNSVSIFLVSAVLSFGCAGKVSNADFIRQEVFPRAAFDISCPTEQLTGQCLDARCTTAGVKGCGRQATYVFVRGSGQWVMNTTGGTVQVAPP
jgi:hypothetical protein